MAASWSVVRAIRCYHRHQFETQTSQFLRPKWKSSQCYAKTCTDQESISTPEALPSWTTEASLYVHWPYCEKRCTYCNFNKYISRNVDEERMKRCLLHETEFLLGRTHISKIKSIFFGGGTPSLAQASTIGAVISQAKTLCSIPDDAEITLEVNPTSTETLQLWAFRDAGVNRISIGLQALNDSDLEMLGRQHSVRDGLRCVDEAKIIFPGRTSVDVIFGRPGQTLSAWQDELDKVLGLCDDHVSLYQLTVERGTELFKQVYRGDLSVPNPCEMADMYECAVSTLQAAGIHRYEASNFARKGAECSHNKHYWQCGQYIGVGPGAHGRYVLQDQEGDSLVRGAFMQTLEPGPWMIEVEQRGHATRSAVKQCTVDILEELLMLGLRTAEGISQERWLAFGGASSLVEIFGSDGHVEAFIDQGLIRLDESGLAASPKGLNVVDFITARLLHILQKHQTITGSKESQIKQDVDINTSDSLKGTRS